MKRKIIGIGILAIAMALGLVALNSPEVDSSGPSFGLAEMQQLEREDAAKPIFYGEIAGIQFKDVVTREEIGCVGPTVAASIEDAKDSPYNFLLKDIPTGFKVAEEIVSACDDNVILVAKVYQGSRGEFSVTRSKGHAIRSLAPQDRMEIIEIGKRPVILIKDLPSPGLDRNTPPEKWPTWEMIAREDEGFILINSWGLPVEEGLQVFKTLWEE